MKLTALYADHITTGSVLFMQSRVTGSTKEMKQTIEDKPPTRFNMSKLTFS